VRISVEHSGDALTLVVDDDVPVDDPTRGLALQRLLDRAAVVDATLTVGGPETSGVHLVCTVPVPVLPADVPGQDTDVTVVPMGARQ
jgi:hypothetical protein